ncbi:MAG TPA: signal peptidase II [Jiangellaceae bacterium]|jgi:signal peptidase II|nr:signal peptidase II [Jiangellaceae bacterium]
MQATGGASLTGDADTQQTGGRRWGGVLLTVAAVVVLLDQIAKIVAVATLRDGQVVEVIDGILELRLVRNPGAAFSFATGMTGLFTAIALVVIIVILRLSRKVTSLPWAVAFGGLLGGAIGNLLDRVFREPAPFRGHVVDFLELPNWPVFNLADSVIVASAALMAWLSLRGVPYDGAERGQEGV